MAPTKKRTSIRAKIASRSKATTSFASLGAAFSEDGNDNTPSEISTGTVDPNRTYQPTKRAKQQAKHTSFLHRVASTGLTNSSGIKKKLKRGRGKEAKSRGKLVTSLSSLADALPDFEGFGGGGDDGDEEASGVLAGNKMIGIPGLSDVNITIARTRSGNIAQEGLPKKMTSLGTKRGMGKKKEKLEMAERDRFQKNVAVMMGDQTFGFGSASNTSTEGALAAGGEGSSASGAASGLQALRAFINRNMAIQKAL
ncbi:Ribosome biogenesis protein Slx9-like [Arthrobotrys flagrans]|uniref:Ribosome biogenesis protein SLX9 n=1 Tax=Arthrobotrys flagrans TaxID=97331 RepID=A0A436ZQ35_ARTFL|nr:Ribosome biogenesis protein Slx9-like [Arthrobotrys flagrans]